MPASDLSGHGVHTNAPAALQVHIWQDVGEASRQPAPAAWQGAPGWQMPPPVPVPPSGGGGVPASDLSGHGVHTNVPAALHMHIWQDVGEASRQPAPAAWQGAPGWQMPPPVPVPPSGGGGVPASDLSGHGVHTNVPAALHMHI